MGRLEQTLWTSIALTEYPLLFHSTDDRWQFSAFRINTIRFSNLGRGSAHAASMFNVRVPLEGSREGVFLMNTFTDAQLIVFETLPSCSIVGPTRSRADG